MMLSTLMMVRGFALVEAMGVLCEDRAIADMGMERDSPMIPQKMRFKFFFII